MKQLVSKGIFDGMQTLESFAVLDVPDEVISIVARIVAATKKMALGLGGLTESLATCVLGGTTSP